MRNILVFINTLSTHILDLLLPAPRDVRRLEAMSPSNFIAHAKPAGETPGDAISLFDYKDPLVKALVWQIKFKGNRKIAHLAAQLLHERLILELSEKALFEAFEKPLLVPVPVTNKRLQERGFSQTQLLATLMEKIDGDKNFTIAEVVAKAKDTISQTKTETRTERLENIKGSFLVTNPNQVKGRNIIILDDVLTTGSTFFEMKRVLLAAGARQVIGLTFAH